MNLGDLRWVACCSLKTWRLGFAGSGASLKLSAGGSGTTCHRDPDWEPGGATQIKSRCRETLLAGGGTNRSRGPHEGKPHQGLWSSFLQLARSLRTVISQMGKYVQFHIVQPKTENVWAQPPPVRHVPPGPTQHTRTLTLSHAIMCTYDAHTHSYMCEHTHVHAHSTRAQHE